MNEKKEKEMIMFKKLKEINPDDLKLYLRDSWLLSYNKGIQLIYHYVEKLIKRTSNNLHLSILNSRYRDTFLNNNTRIHLFRNYTGSIKNDVNNMWINFINQLSSKIEGFVVLSVEYEHDTNKVKKIIVKHDNQIGCIGFEEKNRLCSQLNTKTNKKSITIKTLMNNGISIRKYCKNECPESDICIYTGNCQRIIKPAEQSGFRNWISIQHQLGHILPIYMYFVGDIILILDENVSDIIKEYHHYNIPLLNRNLEFLEKVIKELKPDEDENYKYFTKELKKLLEIFIQSLSNNLTELNYNIIGDILDNIDDSKGIDNNYIDKLNEQAYIYIKNDEISLFKYIFGEICNFIDNYEEHLSSNYNNIENWMKASFYKNQKECKITFSYYNKHEFEILFRKDNIAKLIIKDISLRGMKNE